MDILDELHHLLLQTSLSRRGRLAIEAAIKELKELRKLKEACDRLG